MPVCVSKNDAESTMLRSTALRCVIVSINKTGTKIVSFPAVFWMSRNTCVTKKTAAKETRLKEISWNFIKGVRRGFVHHLAFSSSFLIRFNLLRPFSLMLCFYLFDVFPLVAVKQLFPGFFQFKIQRAFSWRLNCTKGNSNLFFTTFFPDCLLCVTDNLMSRWKQC